MSGRRRTAGRKGRQMLTEEKIKEFCITQYKAKNSPRQLIPDTPEQWDRILGKFCREPEESAAFTAMILERVRKTAAFLREYDFPGPDDEILDLGCGIGLYTTEFAAHAKKVTAMDFSRNLLVRARDRNRRAGFENVDYELCDIKTLNPEERGWSRKFDLVFSAMTPDCYQYESVRKMEAMSRKFCCLQIALSTTYDPGTDIMRQVFGSKTVLSRDRRTEFQLLNDFLSLEGGFPSVRYYRDGCSVPADEEEYLVRMLARAHIRECTDEQMQKLRDLAGQKKENGVLQTRQEWLAGWILWDVREKECCPVSG